jgi:chemotaxis protein CheX
MSMDSTRTAELIRSTVVEVFSTMLGSDLEIGEPIDDNDPFMAAEVVSMVELTGSVSGSLALQCGREHARDLTARFLGADGQEIESLDDVRDAVGELVNMIGGNLKTAIGSDRPIELSLPTVVTTPKTDVKIPATFGVAVPFRDHFGEFFVEFAMASESGTAS